MFCEVCKVLVVISLLEKVVWSLPGWSSVLCTTVNKARFSTKYGYHPWYGLYHSTSYLLFPVRNLPQVVLGRTVDKHGSRVAPYPDPFFARHICIEDLSETTDGVFDGLHIANTMCMNQINACDVFRALLCRKLPESMSKTATFASATGGQARVVQGQLPTLLLQVTAVLPYLWSMPHVSPLLQLLRALLPTCSRM